MPTVEVWPDLPYEAWRDTYVTLHMWTQIVGKIALANAPPINHSWGVALHLTPRGLTTAPLPHDTRVFTIEFDFIEHQLEIKVSDGRVRAMRLAPRTVADFYRELMATLDELSLGTRIWPTAVEIPSAIRLDQDVADYEYDPEYANRCWRILLQVERVFEASRAWFLGKSSPAHFFWGSFDLAVTRFSGRPAPPRDGPAFMREAYSREEISHGFWPGSPPVVEPAFYAYASPEPSGLRAARVQPDAAYYHAELGEFILPYAAVRTAPSPRRALEAFIGSTYEAAASLAHWDRAALEREAPAPRRGAGAGSSG
jgi:hypothetical protein